MLYDCWGTRGAGGGSFGFQFSLGFCEVKANERNTIRASFDFNYMRFATLSTRCEAFPCLYRCLLLLPWNNLNLTFAFSSLTVCSRDNLVASPNLSRFNYKLLKKKKKNFHAFKSAPRTSSCSTSLIVILRHFGSSCTWGSCGSCCSVFVKLFFFFFFVLVFFSVFTADSLRSYKKGNNNKDHKKPKNWKTEANKHLPRCTDAQTTQLVKYADNSDISMFQNKYSISSFYLYFRVTPPSFSKQSSKLQIFTRIVLRFPYPEWVVCAL